MTKLSLKISKTMIRQEKMKAYKDEAKLKCSNLAGKFLNPETSTLDFPFLNL